MPTAKKPATRPRTRKPAVKKPKAFVKPVEEPAATVGPTGLCLQCKKPADHKHAGV